LVQTDKDSAGLFSQHQPAEQLAPPKRQEMPQPPQSSGEVGHWQDPPQQIEPPVQRPAQVGPASAHVPSAHTWPSGQMVPHAPQLRGSRAVLMHMSSQHWSAGSGSCHQEHSSVR
jgi:hypothetical protein